MIRATRTEDPMKIAGRKDCIRDIRRAKKRHAQIIPVANAVYGEALKMGEEAPEPFADPYYSGYIEAFRSFVNRFNLNPARFPTIYKKEM